LRLGVVTVCAGRGVSPPSIVAASSSSISRRSSVSAGLKHQWLFLHSLDSVTTVRQLAAFYVDELNRVLPDSAFRGQTPDEMHLRHRGRGAGSPDVTRGRRPPHTN
jgi:hypothetical protein